MISLEEAQQLILANISSLPSERVSLADGLDRFLSQSITAGRTVPPADNSAMDGFAVRTADVTNASPEHPVRLLITGSLPAEAVPAASVSPGQAMKIMTGSPIPDGADAVIPVEQTQTSGPEVVISHCPRPGENIRRAGEDIREGQVILESGIRLGPAQLGLLASQGETAVAVGQRPRVAILATGNELVEPGQPAKSHEIYSSNHMTLISQVRQCSGIPLFLGIARDNAGQLESCIRAAAHCEVLVTSGGISMGDFDLVKQALDKLGLETIFWKVAIKPGMPTLFGRLRQQWVFALPGNPVASMVCFEQFVRPAILKLQGAGRLFRPKQKVTLAAEIHKKPGRLHLQRAQLMTDQEGRYLASVTGDQGSGILSSMAQAQALLILPADRRQFSPGEQVWAYLLELPQVE